MKFLPEDPDELRRFATYASMSVAAILIVAKFAAWTVTDSVSMMSSLFDSAFDLLASVITAIGVASALKPPDHNHRWGHGKAEQLAALAQSAFIIGSALLLVVEASGRFYHPRAVQNETVAYAVMVFSMALTFALVRFQKHVIGKTNSAAVGADSLHYVGDLGVNFAVIVAVALGKLTGKVWFDPVFAIGISGVLAFSAVKILRSALFSLMDTELPDDQRQRIVNIVKMQHGVFGVHDMRTRSDGELIFIEMHVEMDGCQSLQSAHELTERILDSLVGEIPNVDVIIHQDPVGHEEPRRDSVLT